MRGFAPNRAGILHRTQDGLAALTGGLSQLPSSKALAPSPKSDAEERAAQRRGKALLSRLVQIPFFQRGLFLVKAHYGKQKTAFC